MKTRITYLFLVSIILMTGTIQTIAQANLETAKKILRSKSASLQLQPGDFDCLILKNQYRSKLSGVTNSYFTQCYEGIEVYNAIFNMHFTKEGELLTWGSRLVPNLKASIQGTSPVLSPAEAVAAAAQQLGYDVQEPLIVKETPGGVDLKVVFERGNLSVEDIPVRLVYQPIPDGKVRLAWDLNIYQHDGQHWWSVRVDAGTGQILHQDDWVVTCNFGHPAEDGHHHHTEFSPQRDNTQLRVNPAIAGVYNVYPQPVESPSHGSRQLVSDPDDPTASPFGWHDTDGTAGAEFTITRGNNVYAQLDDDDDNSTFGFAPDGGAGLVFDFPIDLMQEPDNYVSAAVTNLFYWNNYMHDLMYGYGFDEQSGNFQDNNYGNGGLGGDYVIADAQDAGGLNNANFATPPDGGMPRMQMYLWDLTSPMRDGDLDNGIIAHEYGHGISIRQTGGPANSGCLNNDEQMGEGWSDFYSLMTTLEPGDMGTDSRGIGTYALGQPPSGGGIRPTPYSTDMNINPATYGNIGSLAIPHGVGYVWCTMIWEMTWGIIAQDGMAAGFDVAMNLVNEGLKLQPCSPGFVDGRDAILAADVALYGGAHTCIIWAAFAKRGLGFSALQGSPNSTTDGTEAFDMPPSCTLEAMPASVSVCQPANAEYVLYVGPNNGDVTLSAVAGVPPGAMVGFSVNPVPPSGSSTMTISNTAAVAPGTYTITVEGVGVFNTVSTDVMLIIHADNPAVPVLQTPADNDVGVSILPVLVWSGTGADEYTVQVASDAAFTNIVETAMPQNATYTLTIALLPLTTYYWRAKALNACGETAYSPHFTFTTADVVCGTWASTNVPVTIPDNDAATVVSTLDIAAFGAILDVNVQGLDITHTWVNDLVISLTSPQGTTVILMDQPCSGEDDILINFDDEAANPNFPCPPTDNGNYQPFSPLSAFDGENLSGTWTLTIEDVFAADGGTLNDWSLNICYIPIEYCASGPMNPDDTKIDSVHFNTIAVASDPNLCETYTDNTSISTTVTAGSTYDLTIVNGSCSGNHYTAYTAAYIDFNNDGDFEDTGELVYSFGPTTGLNTIPPGSVAIPAMAPPGSRRMRIVLSEDGADPPSCGTYSYGETEDYTITIENSPCPAPNNLTTANITHNSASLTWTPGGSCSANGEYWILANPSSAPTPGTGTSIACPLSFPVNVTGLMVNSAYDVWVLEDCGANGTAGPSNLGTFNTLPEPLSNPSACQLNLVLGDGNCPASDIFPINVTTAPGTSLGTDVILTDVNLIIGHTWTADLEMFLVSPNGAIVELSTGNGGSGDNYGNPNDTTTCTQVTNFNMIGANGPVTAGSAPFIGSYIPEGNFAGFNDGSSPIGLWQLRICDNTGSDIGTLKFVSLSFASSCTPVAWYEDSDGDGYGNPMVPTLDCTAPVNYVADNTDCDDGNAAIYPGAPELCNGLDDDCNGNSEAASNTWTGLGDAANWSDPANWSDGIVPIPCQDVVVPGGNSVTIPPSFNAVGRTLDVLLNAILQMGTGATLDIQN